MMDASAAVSVILGSSQLGTPPKRSGTPVDVPNGWDPRTNKQPTGLFVTPPLAGPCCSSSTEKHKRKKTKNRLILGLFDERVPCGTRTHGLQIHNLAR